MGTARGEQCPPIRALGSSRPQTVARLGDKEAAARLKVFRVDPANLTGVLRRRGDRTHRDPGDVGGQRGRRLQATERLRRHQAADSRVSDFGPPAVKKELPAVRAAGPGVLCCGAEQRNTGTKSNSVSPGPAGQPLLKH